MLTSGGWIWLGVGEEKLDEAVLQGVASTTGGRYFHAADRAEKIDEEEEDVVEEEDGSLYQVPVSAIVCDFAPVQDGGPVLLEHHELEVFFHEVCA